MAWRGRFRRSGKEHIPLVIRPATEVIQFLATPDMKHTLRYLLSRQAEVLR